MSSSPALIENISDTAFWIASMRAQESARPDALFHDPYASVLAGERGARIAQELSGGQMMSWYVALRTRLIDEMLVHTVEQLGCDTVLNLAAGLDTRPYRLALPASLRWIDLDLPAVLSYKAEKLADVQPTCSYEQVALDLGDIAARRAFFERLQTQSKRIFVLVEGLTAYLTREQLASLLIDLHAHPAFHWLLTEFQTALRLQHLRSTFNAQLIKGNAPIQLELNDTEGFYREYGWEMKQLRLTAEAAIAFNRTMPFFWQRQEMYREIGGFALFERHG